MSALVAYRRKRAKAAESRGWEAALEHCARFLEHNAVATIHFPGCAENDGRRCDCPRGGISWIGPAVRDVWN